MGNKKSGMLILTRRVGESLVIDEEITVTVLGVNGNQVRIGINAPKEVPVHREEIHDRIMRERENEIYLHLNSDSKKVMS